MAEDKDSSTPKQAKKQTRRALLPRVVEVILLALLIASSIAVFFLAGGDMDNRAVLWGIRVGAVVVVTGASWRLIRIGHEYQWTGLGAAELPKKEDVEFRPKKTLWDWLQLLIVPIALSLITVVFTWQQDVRQEAIEDRRAKQVRETEAQRAQNEALQAYLDQMSTLLIKQNLRDSKEDSEVRTLARARTLTVLVGLDGRRKRQVVQFLKETKLLGSVWKDPVISLSGADLSYADLDYADLSGADLSGANLYRVDLHYADLHQADLSFADLRYANLSHANVTSEQVLEAQANCGATMRNTTKYRPCPKDLDDLGEYNTGPWRW